MLTEEKIIEILSEIAQPDQLTRRRGRTMGVFRPREFPMHPGPKNVRCHFRFVRDNLTTDRVVFTFKSEDHISRLPMPVIIEWLNSFETRENHSFGKLRLKIDDEKDGIIPLDFSVRRVVDLQIDDDLDIKRIVIETLEYWQRTVYRFSNYERIWMKDEMKRSATTSDERHFYSNRPEYRASEKMSKPDPVQTSTELCETPEEILAELEKLIGLHNVKNLIKGLAQRQHISRLRAAHGMAQVLISPHLVFTGNPGTGKTTVARLIGRLYKSLDLLVSGHVVVTGRVDLVGEYIGHSAPKTLQKCEEALGGVLFIDEAYSLFREGRDFGGEVVATLLTFMEEHRGDMVVVVAGYPEPMDTFLDSNPGLRSRFDQTLHFRDYSPSELLRIFDDLLVANDYEITFSARDEVAKILAKMSKKENFANGRDVRNLFNDMVTGHAASLMGLREPTKEQLKLMTTMSIPKKLRIDKSIDLSGFDELGHQNEA